MKQTREHAKTDRTKKLNTRMNSSYHPRARTLAVALTCLFALGILAPGAQAETFTWTGGSGLYMSTPENWDPDGLPINGNIGVVDSSTARINANLYSDPDTAPSELRALTGGIILLAASIAANHNIVLDGGTFGGGNTSYSYAGATKVKSDSTLTGMYLSGTLADYDGLNTGMLTYTTSGRLWLGGDNSSFTGGFEIQNGSIDLVGANALGMGTLEFTVNANNKDLNLGGFNATVTSLSGTPGTGSVLIQSDPWDTIFGTGKYNDATLTVDQDVDTTYGGTFQHAFAVGFRALNLIKTGTGILTLTGASSINWDNAADSKTISEGILVVGHADALGTGGTITVGGNGTLAIGSGVTFTQLVTFVAGSTLGGNGTYNPGSPVLIANGMNVAPGVSPGILTLPTTTFGDGSGDDETLVIELGGTTVGTEYDQLAGLSGATLTIATGSSLDIVISDTYPIPSTGASYQVLDWDTIAGEFSTIILPDHPGWKWDTSALYTTGTITATPNMAGTVIFIR